MTLKAKILKRAADWYITNGSEAVHFGAAHENKRLAPLLEALAECVEKAKFCANRYAVYDSDYIPSVRDVIDCEADLKQALSNLERLLSSETKQRDE